MRYCVEPDFTGTRVANEINYVLCVRVIVNQSLCGIALVPQKAAVDVQVEMLGNH